MKALFLSILWLSPSLLLAGQEQANLQKSKPNAYRVWVYDQTGKRIAKGYYHALTDSSLRLEKRHPGKKITWQKTAYTEISLDHIEHVEYRATAERKQRSSRAGVQTFVLSSLLASIIGIIALSPADPTDGYWVIYALLVIISLFFGLVFLSTLSVYLFVRLARPYRTKIMRVAAGALDLSPLE